MNFCLQPPNSALLSDDVIGGVILRSKSTNPLFVGFGGTSTTNTTTSSHFDQDRLVSSPNLERSAVKRKRSRNFGELFASAFEGVIRETNRQRELRRRRQIRYRKKKEDLAITLEQDTKQLCLEIQELQQRHQAITSAIPVKETAWNVAAQYFHLFRYGYRPPTSATTGLAPSCIQFAFVRATMASDIVHDAGRGVESLLVHWTRMTLWFQDFDYRLISLEQDTEDSVVATTTTTFSITDATLVNMFPHLCEDERGPRRSLAKKLLGQ